MSVKPDIFLAAIVLIGLVAGGTLFREARARSTRQLASCKSNLNQMHIALEMYSVDWDRHYPKDPKPHLTPNFLKTIPECPAAGTDTYVFEVGPAATYNTQSYQDYFLIRCDGSHHRKTNFPQFSSLVGLIVR